MKHFVIIVNGFQLLTFITKRSILDVAAVLDPPLQIDLLASTEIPKKYIDVPENYDLNNHITKATRNGNKFLDHIISNIPANKILHSDLLPCATTSNHDQPYIIVNMPVNKFETRIQIHKELEKL